MPEDIRSDCELLWEIPSLRRGATTILAARLGNRAGKQVQLFQLSTIYYELTKTGSEEILSVHELHQHILFLVVGGRVQRDS